MVSPVVAQTHQHSGMRQSTASNPSLALACVDRHWAVFPCKADKKPITPNGFKDATLDPEKVRKWWERHPGALIGIACSPSSFFAVDLDRKNGADGVAAFEKLVSQHGGIEYGPAQTTPSGGAHILFNWPDNVDINQSASKLAPGIDVRAMGYICTGNLPDGRAYVWNSAEGHGIDAAIPNPPDWLLELVSAKVEDPKAAGPTPIAAPRGDISYWLDRFLPQATPGRRNEIGFTLACQVRDEGFTQAECEALPYPEQCPHGNDAYTRSEWLESVKSAYDHTPRQPARKQGATVAPKPEESTQDTPVALGFELSDLGNADRFIRLYGNVVRYSVRHGDWFVWDGQRWSQDERGRIYDLAGRAVRSIFSEAAGTKDKSEAARLSKWALRSQDRVQIEHMLALAKNRVALLIDELDKNPQLLNCKNGTVNLVTGELQPHEPDELITKVVNANFDKDAECPTWTAFLYRIMAGNNELIQFLQRAVGYSLTGLTTEQVLFILYGSGANGKSTFLETLTRLLGDGYAAGTPTESIMQKRFDGGIPNDLARLKGARLVSINEVEHGRRMAESKIKQMTGGDTITARFMRGEYFDFIPEFKLWLRTNHKPVIVGTDNAIWRRIRLIPFEVQIPPTEQNPNLMEELAKEYDGILSWAIAGCIAWQRERLNPPEEVTNATKGYRDEMDMIGHFLKEKTEAGEYVFSKALYSTYSTWCDDSGERPIAQRTFSQAITERGYASKHTKRGNVFIGLSITESVKDGEG